MTKTMSIKVLTFAGRTLRIFCNYEWYHWTILEYLISVVNFCRSNLSIIFILWFRMKLLNCGVISIFRRRLQTKSLRLHG